MHWLGPYLIKEIINGGVVQLTKLNGEPFPGRVNRSRLKLYIGGPVWWLYGGRIVLVFQVVARERGTINYTAKFGVLALWHRFGTMTQVLSLMATHSDCRSQFRLLEWKKNSYKQFPLNQATYTHGIIDQKVHMHIHTLSCTKKCVHVGKLIFSPWYLVLGIWTYGFGPWYLVWSVEPKYLVQGIDSL